MKYKGWSTDVNQAIIALLLLALVIWIAVSKTSVVKQDKNNSAYANNTKPI
jgi:hypothetical protein